VDRAIAKDPAERFPDGGALLRAVDETFARRGAPAGDAGPTGTAVMPLPVLTPESDRHVTTPPPERRRPTALIAGAAAAILLIAALVVGIGVLTAGDGESSAATTPTTAEQTTTAAQTPPTVTLDPAAYVGRPVAEVQAELTGLGLTVALQTVQTADVAEGSVTALTPTDALPAGATVTVSYAVAPPPPPVVVDEDNGNGNSGNGNGNGNNRNGNGDKKKDRGGD
jgi:serine/threonine-protein kinase